MLQDWIVALAATPVVYLVLFALATLDGFFPPVPSEASVIALAALSVSVGAPDLRLVVLAAAAGAFTGDQVAYAIGRRIDVRGTPLLRSPRAQRAVDRAERALAQRGASFILAARYVPVGRVAVNMTAGAVGFPMGRFTRLAALAALSWSVYCVAIGLAAGAWFDGRPLLSITVGVVGGLLSGFFIDWAIHRVHARGGRAASTPDVTAGAQDAMVADDERRTDPVRVGS